MGKDAPSPPSIPSAGENLASTIELLLERGPEIRGLGFLDVLANLETLAQLAPAQAGVQLGFESEFGPQFRAAETQAGLETLMGQLSNVATISPLLQAAQQAAGPTTEAVRGTLGSQILTELQAGAGLDPGLRGEIEQAVRSAQTARGISFGAAPVAAEAFTLGSAGQQLRRQRQQAATQFLNTQASTQVSPFSLVAGAAARPLAQPQLPGGILPSVSGLIPNILTGERETGLLQAQQGFNLQQLNQPGGIGGALSGGLGAAGAAAAIPALAPFALPFAVLGATLGAR